MTMRLILNVSDRTIHTSIQKLKELDYIDTRICGAKTGIMRVIVPNYTKIEKWRIYGTRK